MDYEHLPPHVLIKIFSHLTCRDIVCGVRQTCWSWYHLSFHKIFWNSLDLSNFSDVDTTKASFLALVASISECIETLHVNVDWAILEEVLFENNYGPNVRHLKIKLVDDVNDKARNQRSNSDLFTCLKKMSVEQTHNILSLSFLHCQSWQNLLEDLTPIFPDLSEISVDFCKQVPEEFFLAHRSLKSISLQNSSVDPKVLQIMLRDLPCLKTLNLACCILGEDLMLLTEKEIRIETCCPNLTELVLDCAIVKDSLFCQMVKGANNLQHISISNCSYLTNIGIECLAQHCPKLHTLILNSDNFSTSNVTNSALEFLAANCKYLHTLKANFCKELSDPGLNAVATYCSRLTHLDFGGCTALTDNSVLRLVSNCPKLLYLDLGSCVQLTSASVNSVLRSLIFLQYLNLDSCHRLSGLNLIDDSYCVKNISMKKNHYNCVQDDNMVENYTEKTCDENRLVSLANHSHLHRLDLRFCSNLTNRCVQEIAAWCPDLRELDIQACSMVSNTGLIDIVNKCQFLTKLNASGGSIIGSSKLNDDFLSAVAEHCQNLKILQITAVYDISVDGVAGVIIHCPNIEEIKVSENRCRQKTVIPVNERTLLSIASGIQRKLIHMSKAGSIVRIFLHNNVENKMAVNAIG